MSPADCAAISAGHGAQPLVGLGERGGRKQARGAQDAGGKHCGTVVAYPLDDGGQPELDGLRHALGLQPGDDVAVGVPAHPAAHGGAGDLEPVRAPVLVAVAGRRHDDQPLAQRLRTGASYS